MTGSVQGVSFRQTTVQQANALGLRGWVHNEPDGSVSGEAAGPTEHIQKLCVGATDPGATICTSVRSRRVSTTWTSCSSKTTT